LAAEGADDDFGSVESSLDALDGIEVNCLGSGALDLRLGEAGQDSDLGRSSCYEACDDGAPDAA